MIDRSKIAMNSFDYDWFIDADPTPCHGSDFFPTEITATQSNLISLGFDNYYFTIDDDTITTHNKPIMNYSSNGVHTTAGTDNSCGQTYPPDYIMSKLNFNFPPGSIFNTAESFNANTLGTWPIIRRDGAGMGQVPEFILCGGTVGVGHAFEPLTTNIVEPSIMFPSYQIGYSFIESAYLGMPNLTGENVVVGDPLTTIAWGKQTLTEDVTMEGTNLVTGEINIQDLKTLTIANNSVITLKHQGFITGEGKLIIGQNVTFNIYDWQKGLFLSYDGANPRLVWGSHPTFGESALYKVYRQIGTGNWSLIATTTALEYTDEEMYFYIPGGDESPNVFYKVTAQSELPGAYESNTVSTIASKEKMDKEGLSKFQPVEFSLGQNYPNPFNPSTQIQYSIKEEGLVQLRVYDILGKEIVTLVNTNKEAGYYSVDFDASQLPSGVYIYQLTTPGFTQARKMIFTK